MSRTSKTLLRLGVPSLAAATLVAGVPAFLGTANAAHIASLTLTPETATAAAGTCVPYTARLTFSAGQAARVEDIDVILDENPTNTAQDVDFCTAPTTVGTSTVQPATADAGSVVDGGNAGTRDQAEFTTTRTVAATSTDAGFVEVTFGVVSNTTGGANIRAFYEVDGSATDNNSFDAGEFTDTSTATFTAGGAAGSNEAADAVTSLAAAPAADTAVAGESRSFAVTASNGATPANTVAGVTVRYQVGDATTAIKRSGVLGVTNNDGVARGTVPFPVAADETVTFFVNQTDGTTVNFDSPAEPSAVSTVTVVAASTQQNRTVTVAALPDEEQGTSTFYANNPAVNPASDGDRTFRAFVDGTSTAVTSTNGTLLSFAVSGGSGDETVAPREAATTDAAGSPAAATADTNDSSVDVVVNDPTPTVGQTLTVTATVRGTTATGSSTLTFRNTPADARNISLVPETATTAPNTARTFTATVVDSLGNGVAGVAVNFSESGAGAFRNGSSSVDAVTNASGVATVETISLPGEVGTQTITATVTTTGTQVGQAAGAGTTPTGTAVPASQTAGNASDTSVNTFAVPTATPTATTRPATPTAGPGTPTGVACTNPAGITLDRSVTRPGRPVKVTVRSVPNSVVELRAYSRPSTEYRTVRQTEVGASGVVEFMVVPGTNTRLFAQCVANTRSASASVVINVRTAISLTVVRNSTRNYTFKGTILPRRAGQLISLYRVNANGTRVLSAQVKTDASGVYSFNRRFTGSGVFGFVTRTGQNLTNAAGESNTPDSSTTGVGTPRRTAIF